MMLRPRSLPTPASWRRAPRTLVALALALVLASTLTSCGTPTLVARQPVEHDGGQGLWISPAEIAQLPMRGEAWDRLVEVAYGDWGQPTLSDLNSRHDTATLAGALVAVRTGDAALRARTQAAIMAVSRTTSYARVLELARSIPPYVVAADLVGLSSGDEMAFRQFLDRVRTIPLFGHSAGTDLVSTALRSPANWGTMARAAVTAIDLYLGDQRGLRQMADTHRAWLGESAPNQLVWSGTGWHASNPKAGINRRGATKMGRNVDGVLPEDQRRSGEPSSRPAEHGSYPWEALQGELVTGVLLDRAGLVDINAGDGALVRAFTWLYTTNTNPPSADDQWQPWVLNRIAGTRFATTVGGSPGKNMGWGDWTHGPRAR